MTREEAFEYARRIRNKTQGASIICLDGEAIDAILSSPWVSVKDRMPKMEYLTMDGDFSEPVLTVNADNRYNLLIYCIVGGEKFWAFGYDGEGDYIEDSFNQITHWMPIPKVKED